YQWFWQLFVWPFVTSVVRCTNDAAPGCLYPASHLQRGKGTAIGSWSEHFYIFWQWQRAILQSPSLDAGHRHAVASVSLNAFLVVSLIFAVWGPLLPAGLYHFEW